MIHGLAGIFEALLELRDVEDIMDFEFFWKLQCISNFSSSTTYLERTDVSRSQLSFDTEAVCSSHGSDTKVDEVTRGIYHICVLAVIVALLTTLSNLQDRKSTRLN